MFRILGVHLAPEKLFRAGSSTRPPPKTIKAVEITAHAGKPRPCLGGGSGQVSSQDSWFRLVVVVVGVVGVVVVVEVEVEVEVRSRSSRSKE